MAAIFQQSAGYVLWYWFGSFCPKLHKHLSCLLFPIFVNLSTAIIYALSFFQILNCIVALSFNSPKYLDCIDVLSFYDSKGSVGGVFFLIDIVKYCKSQCRTSKLNV